MKLTVLTLLVVVALATFDGKTNRITLERGRRNSVSFVCGAIDQKSGREGIYLDKYSYTFSGQPKWLTANGARLEGDVPATAVGDFPVTVTYRSVDGRRTGRSIYTLSAAQQAFPFNLGGLQGGRFGSFFNARYGSINPNLASYIRLGNGLFLNDVGRYTILWPTISAAEAIPAKITPLNIVAPDTTGASSATGVSGGGAAALTGPGSITFTNGGSATDGSSVVSAGNSVTTVAGTDNSITVDPTVDASSSATTTVPIDVQVDPVPTPVDATVTDTTTSVAVDPAAGNIVSTTTDSNGATTSSNGATASATGNALSALRDDRSCNGIATGDVVLNGVVTSVGANSIVVNGRTFNFGRCSRRTYGRGKKAFQVNDKITVRGWPGSNKSIWVKSAVCT